MFDQKVIIIDLISSKICKQNLFFYFRSLLTSKTGINNRQKKIFHSDDRIFEHPEVTIKPSALDDKISRRLLTSNKSFIPNENSGGSVPNILEHPDIRTPIVMETQQSSPSLSSSSSSDKGKLFRQQSGKTWARDQRMKFPFHLADVYSTLARTTSPTHLGIKTKLFLLNEFFFS